jgi:hypothetical protein
VQGHAEGEPDREDDRGSDDPDDQRSMGPPAPATARPAGGRHGHDR